MPAPAHPILGDLHRLRDYFHQRPHGRQRRRLPRFEGRASHHARGWGAGRRCGAATCGMPLRGRGDTAGHPAADAGPPPA
eukprot:1301727-Pyramimonas_sp.AAC.1